MHSTNLVWKFLYFFPDSYLKVVVFLTLELTSTERAIHLEGLGFSSAEKEQARTRKMNDINGQPILPGTCD